MTSAPVLRLTGITKTFGTTLANDAISIALAAGEVLALLGENGAGKTTLMSILFGHYTPDAGKAPYGESSMWGDYHAMELAVYLNRMNKGQPYYTFFA